MGLSYLIKVANYCEIKYGSKEDEVEPKEFWKLYLKVLSETEEAMDSYLNEKAETLSSDVKRAIGTIFKIKNDYLKRPGTFKDLLMSERGIKDRIVLVIENLDKDQDSELLNPLRRLETYTKKLINNIHLIDLLDKEEIKKLL